MYMAPEILNKKRYSIKSDIWSVGVILFQMLYGKTPFISTNIIALTTEVNKDNIKYDTEFVISPICKELLKHMLTRDPNNRISWQEFFNHEWFKNDTVMDEQNNLMDISFTNGPDINNYVQNESQFNSFVYKSIYAGSGTTGIDDGSLEFNFHLNEDDLYESCEVVVETSVEASSEEEEVTPIHSSRPISINQSYVVVNRPITSLPNKKKSLTDSFKEYISRSVEFVKHSYDYISNS